MERSDLVNIMYAMGMSADEIAYHTRIQKPSVYNMVTDDAKQLRREVKSKDADPDGYTLRLAGMISGLLFTREQARE